MASNTFVLNLLVFWNYHHHQRSSLTWGRGCSDSSGNTACGRQPHPQWSFPFHRLVFHTGSTYCHPAMTNTWRHNLWHDNLKSHLTCILAACHGCHPLWLNSNWRNISAVTSWWNGNRPHCYYATLPKEAALRSVRQSVCPSEKSHNIQS